MRGFWVMYRKDVPNETLNGDFSNRFSTDSAHRSDPTGETRTLETTEPEKAETLRVYESGSFGRDLPAGGGGDLFALAPATAPLGGKHYVRIGDSAQPLHPGAHRGFNDRPRSFAAGERNLIVGGVKGSCDQKTGVGRVTGSSPGFPRNF